MKNKLLALLFIAAMSSSVYSERSHALYYVTLTETWTQMWAPGDTIPVCFTTSGLENEKARIRNVLNYTWQAIANVTFTGFGACPTTGTQKFVRVYINTSPTGSYWAIAGKASLLPPSTDPLNASMELFWPTGFNIDESIVHEFGHILGFGHEQDRADNPTPEHPVCNWAGSLEGVYLSAFDPNSVMNYCAEPRDGHLTALDVEGAQKAYPYTVPYMPLSIPLASTSAGIRSGLYYRARSNGELAHDTNAGFTTFTSTQELPYPGRAIGAVESTPAAIVTSGSTLLLWKARDGKLWQREVSASAVSSTGGNILDVGPLTSAPQAAENGGTKLVVWRGADNYLYAKRGTSSGWSTAMRLNTGTATSVPTLVASLSGVFEVYWRGTDNALWRMQSTSGGVSWSAAQRIALGPLDSAPHAVGHADGTVDIFWRGSDKYLFQWHGTYGSAGSVVRHNSGTMRSEPSATLTSTGNVHVVWGGTDKNLWYMSSSFNTWSAPVNLETVFDAPPRIRGNDTGALDIAFMAGKKIALKRYRPGTGWVTTRFVNGPGM